MVGPGGGLAGARARRGTDGKFWREGSPGGGSVGSGQGTPDGAGGFVIMDPNDPNYDPQAAEYAR